jgi:predicted small lipoprotein YifL
MRRTAILLAVLLSACGQAGDLYLPGEPPAPEPVPVPGTSSSTPVITEADKKKED